MDPGQISLQPAALSRPLERLAGHVVVVAVAAVVEVRRAVPAQMVELEEVVDLHRVRGARAVREQRLAALVRVGDAVQELQARGRVDVHQVLVQAEEDVGVGHVLGVRLGANVPREAVEGVHQDADAVGNLLDLRLDEGAVGRDRVHEENAETGERLEGFPEGLVRRHPVVVRHAQVAGIDVGLELGPVPERALDGEEGACLVGGKLPGEDVGGVVGGGVRGGFGCVVGADGVVGPDDGDGTIGGVDLSALDLEAVWQRGA